MLFRKDIQKSCQYCLFGAAMEEDLILCSKKGIKSCADKCRRFRYDPFKRIPSKQKTLDFSKYHEDDYSL